MDAGTHKRRSHHLGFFDSATIASELRRLAIQRGCSLSDVLRHAVREHL